MKRYWMWGAVGAGLVLLAFLAIPMQRGTRNNQRTDQVGPPATQVRESRMENDLGSTGKDAADTPARLNMRVVNAAESVDGVRQAWAVTLGKTALVGLALETSISDQAGQSTREEAAEQVEELPSIDRATVTSSPAPVSRIRRANEAIAAGSSPAQFEDELRQLLRQLSPASQ